MTEGDTAFFQNKRLRTVKSAESLVSSLDYSNSTSDGVEGESIYLLVTAMLCHHLKNIADFLNFSFPVQKILQIFSSTVHWYLVIVGCHQRNRPIQVILSSMLLS